MCEVTNWQGVLLALWALLEYWLGRTNLIHSGSTVELILAGVKILIRQINTKKGE